MIRKVVEVKDPILRLSAKPVGKIDKKILKVIKDLKDTLEVQKDPPGVGLAAPQIGKSLQVFAIKPKSEILIVINPKVISKVKNKSKSAKGKRHKSILEGCLSLPYYYGPLKRDYKIKIKYMDENGLEKVESFEGLAAQIVQHEIDHLKGVLFVDRLLEQKKPLYEQDGDEWVEVELI